MSLIQLDDLHVSLAGKEVLAGLSCDVAAPAIGLLGPNGAGKTTSFRMAVGMIDPEDGQVFFDGQEVTQLPMYKRAQLGMGYLSQEPSVFQRLTVEQNLLAILETMRHLSRAERRRAAAELVEQFGLTKQARQEARTLSGGERRKLEIARALITNPKLIFLDEPFSGVDPIAVQGLQREILALRGRGIAILLTDHNVRETLTVTDRSYIIDQGRHLASGPPNELINNPIVRDTYLGTTFEGHEFTRQPTN
jgi:lipopolysaccharide export system ATP-binding protein